MSEAKISPQTGEVEIKVESALDYNDLEDSDIQQGPVELEIEGKKITISALTHAGKLPRLNEDAYAIAKRDGSLDLAIFDGVTDVTSHPMLNGLSGARFTSHSLRRMFLQQSRQQKDIKTAMVLLNRQLRDLTGKLDSTDLNRASTLPCSTGTFAKLDAKEGKIEVGHVGDTFCIVYLKDGSSKVLSFDTNRASLYMLSKTPEEAALASQKDGRTKTIESYDQKNNAEVSLYGTGIFNGSRLMEKYVITDEISLNDVSAILMGSDGLLPSYLSASNKRDQKKILEIITEYGLSGLLDATKEEYSRPPDENGKKVRADDSTGIFIEIEG